jgi:hypothetical protein
MTTATVDRITTALDSLTSADDPVRDALLAAIEAAPDIREKHGHRAAGLAEIKPLLVDVPKFLRADAHADLLDLDVRPMVARLLHDCAEFGDIRTYPIRFTWRRTHAESGGGIILGTCAVVPLRERLTWTGAGPAPFWDITLALDAWLLATPAERLWLLHHELMHAEVDFDKAGDPKPKTRGHDIEEFMASAGRFGPQSIEALALADNIRAHPAVAERRRDWATDEHGQGLLFGALEVGS